MKIVALLAVLVATTPVALAQDHADAPDLMQKAHGTMAPRRSLQGEAAGIRWTVPPRWTAEAEREMRVATYGMPASSGGEAGECAVFFFGAGQGGDPQSNVARWAGQFEGSPSPHTATRHIDGLAVTTVDVSGTFLAPTGPMMEPGDAQPHWRLLGAIVDAPQGEVFFKCTGPAAVMGAAQKEFDALIGSLKKE